jgi:hypothetical protein
MFTGLFEGATSNRAALCYNNIQARVLIPSTPIYTKKKHLEEDPSRRPSCLCCKAMNHQVLDCPRMIVKVERMNNNQENPKADLETKIMT